MAYRPFSLDPRPVVHRPWSIVYVRTIDDRRQTTRIARPLLLDRRPSSIVATGRPRSVARIGQFELLQKFYDQIRISVIVQREVVASGDAYYERHLKS
jgi:hypothetical protein